MRIMVLSDTHIPKAAADLPAQIYKEMDNVDLVLHAGDFTEKEVFDKIRVRKEIKAVYGNMDPEELHHVLKSKEIISVGKFKIGLIHGYGAPRDLIETVRSEFKSVNAIVFGHSHSALSTVQDGILFFNPGSPTDKVFASVNSYGILDIDDKKIEGKIVKINE